MSATLERRLTFAEWRRLATTRDTSHRATRLGADVVRYLAWKKSQGASARTLDQYERDLRLLCHSVPYGADKVTMDDILAALSTFPDGSVKRVRAAMGDFFKWTTSPASGPMRPDNPVQWLPKMRPTPPPVYDLWTQAELDLLVAATRRMDNPLRERLRVLAMIETGARAGEARALTLGDFDLYRKTVTVLGKGSRRRLIPISLELAATVDEYLLTPYPVVGRDPKPHDFLWYPVWRMGDRILGAKPEQQLSYRGFYEWWRRVETTAGVRHRKPHMTRHTFATDVLDATDGDLYAVKELLGHSSTRVTETYLHSSRLRKGKAIDALAAYRASNRQTDED